MPYCSSCGAENPEGARFCSKCGNQLSVSSPVQTPKDHPTEPAQPVATSKSPQTESPESQPQPQPPQPQPKAISTEAPQQKEATHQMSPPQDPKQPIPGAPGQTQFFMSAAKVSTGAKVKRVVFFLMGALIIGTAIFFFVRYMLQQQEEVEEEYKKTKSAGHAPAALEGSGDLSGSSQPGSGQPQTATAGETVPTQKPVEAPAISEENKPVTKEKKRTKKKRRKRRKINRP